MFLLLLSSGTTPPFSPTGHKDVRLENILLVHHESKHFIPVTCVGFSSWNNPIKLRSIRVLSPANSGLSQLKARFLHPSLPADSPWGTFNLEVHFALVPAFFIL